MQAFFKPGSTINRDHKEKYLHILAYAASVHDNEDGDRFLCRLYSGTQTPFNEDTPQRTGHPCHSMYNIHIVCLCIDFSTPRHLTDQDTFYGQMVPQMQCVYTINLKCIGTGFNVHCTVYTESHFHSKHFDCELYQFTSSGGLKPLL